MYTYERLIKELTAFFWMTQTVQASITATIRLLTPFANLWYMIRNVNSYP